jgi:hypothetical protein
MLLPGPIKGLVSIAVGWAMAMLFGKVPRRRQPYVSLMASGSVVWALAALAVAFPPFAALLLGFLPLPGPLKETVAWYGLLALAVFVPPLLTLAALWTLDPDHRPSDGAALAVVVLKGYPYALSLAVVLPLMFLLTLIARARDAMRGWTERHLPVIVPPEAYQEVLSEVVAVLERAGHHVRITPAGWQLRLPTWLLLRTAGLAVQDLLIEQLRILRTDSIEVVLHLSDLVIRGPERDANRARALLAEQLAFSRAYLTSEKPARELEDRLRAIWQDAKQRAGRGVEPAQVQQFEVVERDLRAMDLPYEEWEVLTREKLTVERSLLHAATGLGGEPTDLTEAAPEEIGARRLRAAVEAAPAARGA